MPRQNYHIRVPCVFFQILFPELLRHDREQFLCRHHTQNLLVSTVDTTHKIGVDSRHHTQDLLGLCSSNIPPLGSKVYKIKYYVLLI